MSVFITDDCINCSACETECPVHAVMPRLNIPGKRSNYINNLYLAKKYQSFDHYYINPVKCNECSGYYPVPRCNEVCPVSCCLNNENISAEDSFIKQPGVNITTNTVSLTKISLN